ncbi:MAG: phospholipase effector Tle1 domain-containing protein, partial [Acidiferrobacterales bacterium]
MALYAFDGTWQKEEEEAGYENTNIVRFRDAYTEKTCYYRGIGTRGGKVLRLIAGATGLGGTLRIWEAEDDLTKQLDRGDKTIDIVGFSRGAALALDFANEIAERAKKDALRVRFLGLFDTVHSFGVAGIDLNLIHDPDLPDIVDQCFHALALDERRDTFRPTRVPRGYEVWFRGVHSDIGGGNDNPGLNTITLKWMLSKATAVGLPIRSESITELENELDPDASIKPAKFDPIKDPHRDLESTDVIHYTVATRTTGDHNNPPDALLRETEEDERDLVKRS